MSGVQVGDKFDHWTTIGPTHSNRFGTPCHLCRCRCGTTRVIERNKLVNGKTRSCGCGAPALISAYRTTHGHTAHGQRTRAYIAWETRRRWKGEQRTFTEWLAAQPKAAA